MVQGCGCSRLELAESWQALPASCATVTPGNVNPTAPIVEMERQKHPEEKRESLMHATITCLDHLTTKAPLTASMGTFVLCLN